MCNITAGHWPFSDNFPLWLANFSIGRPFCPSKFKKLDFMILLWTSEISKNGRTKLDLVGQKDLSNYLPYIAHCSQRCNNVIVHTCCVLCSSLPEGWFRDPGLLSAPVGVWQIALGGQAQWQGICGQQEERVSVWIIQGSDISYRPFMRSACNFWDPRAEGFIKWYSPQTPTASWQQCKLKFKKCSFLL